MKIKCVTSMNKPYYDRLGKLMIESWSKYWPDDSKLIVYQEGFEIENFDNVDGISWEDYCLSDWNLFRTKVKGPAERFAKKGFAFLSAMKNIDSDLLIWVDADVITHKTFPKDKILSIIPPNKVIAFFDTYYQYNPKYTLEEYLNKNRPCTAIESGFVIVNKNHPSFRHYCQEYERLYKLDAPNEIVGEWFDGNVCAAAAIDIRNEIFDLSNLRTTDKTQTPLNKSWLFEYIYHAKAKQKNNINLDEYRKRLKIDNKS